MESSETQWYKSFIYQNIFFFFGGLLTLFLLSRSLDRFAYFQRVSFFPCNILWNLIIPYFLFLLRFITIFSCFFRIKWQNILQYLFTGYKIVLLLYTLISNHLIFFLSTEKFSVFHFFFKEYPICSIFIWNSSFKKYNNNKFVPKKLSYMNFFCYYRIFFLSI